MIYTALLSFHKDVHTDFARIKSANPAAYAGLLALFRQLKADTRLMEKLLDHGFGAGRSADVSVSKWFDQWKDGKNLWRD